MTTRGFPVLVFFLSFWFTLTGCGSDNGRISLPPRLGLVNDYAGILSESTGNRLSIMLKSYEKESCHQIVVVTVPSLDGEPIALFSERISVAWQIGHPMLNNSVLLVIAIKEGKARIDVGTGLEKIITGGMAETILHRDMIPLFREGNMEEGITRAVEALMVEGRGVVFPPELRPAVCRN